jgi:hypothetical protein
MSKTFYTERDIDELNARGVTSIDLTEDVVLTDLAVERALKYDIKIRRAERSAPKATYSPSVNTYAAYPRTTASDSALKDRIKSAVLARLNGQVDEALLDAVITRVLAGMH